MSSGCTPSPPLPSPRHLCASFPARRACPGRDGDVEALCFRAHAQPRGQAFLLESGGDAGRKGVPRPVPGTELSTGPYRIVSFPAGPGKPQLWVKRPQGSGSPSLWLRTDAAGAALQPGSQGAVRPRPVPWQSSRMSGRGRGREGPGTASGWLGAASQRPGRPGRASQPAGPRPVLSSPVRGVGGSCREQSPSPSLPPGLTARCALWSRGHEVARPHWAAPGVQTLAALAALRPALHRPRAKLQRGRAGPGAGCSGESRRLPWGTGARAARLPWESQSERLVGLVCADSRTT